VAGYCEHGNQYLGSIKGGGFLDYLSELKPLKKNSAPCSYLVCSLHKEEENEFYGPLSRNRGSSVV
jgi:hypothetical protein